MPRERKATHSQPTIEDETWPEQADVLALMGQGFTYDEAWHMSPRDHRRYVALAHAWSIPPDMRRERPVRGHKGMRVFG